MRKILALSCLAMVGLSAGCQMSGCSTKSGFGIWYYNPPSMDVTTPIMLTPTMQSGGAHPMGSAAGPVPTGSFQQAPVAPPVPPAAMPTGPSKAIQLQPILIPPSYGPCLPENAVKARNKMPHADCQEE